ncbi:MAG: cytosolic long-chain acyl-CoA thioester hydrolase family protein [uncultured Aureispira sp.]|uniref:Cytosolic long-chain acyl-CoA thioester hydrolase family protein n=1 Tax=uncultured Aureispira sp. TaxID=1331704 RepID=A0A6S6UBH5_9BACT|nr:MAG: cytosolic long-chain acyl-CoA thioester hydrolase family protein [uncultured Aureispira sp.]
MSHCALSFAQDRSFIYKNTPNMTVKDKIENSITRVFKAVLPNTTNHYNTLFGGTALQMMDEVAFICATRFARKRMVTVTSDQIHFKHSIPAGTLIELIAKVVYVGNTSVKVQVEIYLEEMYEENRMKAITGMFTFVAIDRDRNPTQVVETFVKE